MIGNEHITLFNIIRCMSCFIAMFLGMAINSSAVSVLDFYKAPSGIYLKVENSTDYPWTMNDDGVIASNMHKDNGSASLTFTNNSYTDLYCSFEWSVSSEGDYDFFTCTYGDGVSFSISGEKYQNGTKFHHVSCMIRVGKSLSFKYWKDEGYSYGNDCAYIRNIVFEHAGLAGEKAKWGMALDNSSVKTATILGYYGKDADVMVPSSFTYGSATYQTKTIAERAFYQNMQISSIEIPDGVTEIGGYAFVSCDNLQSVSMPNSVSTIGNNAFQNCSKLKSVNISNKLVKVADYLFDGCKELSSVKLPSSVKTIGYYSFNNCEKLTDCVIPSAVTSIDYFAFSGCKSLKSITIPASVSNIKDNVFAGCSGLTSIAVASANSYYNSKNNCNAIIKTSSNTLISGCKNTVIPDDLPLIGSYAFSGCSNMESIRIPSSVKGIGFNAFYGCSGLKSVDLPGVESLGSSAFYGCTGLKSVNFSDNLLVIGPRVFYNCSSLSSVTIPANVSVGSSAFELCRGLESVTLEADVYSLGTDVFAYCENLSTINIKGNITTLSSSVFKNCKNLRQVNIYNQDVIPVQYNRAFEEGSASGQSTSFASCTLYVPSSSVKSYTTATGWKQFGTIKGFTLGDVNNDGSVNMLDLELMKKMILNIPVTGVVQIAADLDGDGRITISDCALLISRF